MFGSAIIDVAIGLIFVFSLLSMVSTKINDLIASRLQWRAKDLENGVRTLVGDPHLANKVWNHPLVQGLAGKEGQRVTRIPPNTFALALFDAIVPAGNQPTALERVRTTTMALPQSSVRQAILSIADAANGDIGKARTEVENWFNAAMDRVGAVYKQRMQTLSMLVALLVTLIFGADSLSIANTLWQEPVLRAAVAGTAQGTPAENIQDAVNSISQISLPIGWATLPTTWPGWGQKILGLLLTTLAVSLGAPFWYDLLRNVSAARSSSFVTPPQK